MRKCLHCLKEYPDHMAFCPECGKALSEVVKVQERFCPKCGMKNKQGALFCENCGSSLTKEQTAGAVGNPGGMPVTGAGNPGGMPVTEAGNPGGMPMSGAAGNFGGMPVTGTNSNPAGNSTEKSRQSTSKIPLAVGLAVFLVIAGAAGLTGFFLMRSSNSDHTAVVKEVTSEAGEEGVTSGAEGEGTGNDEGMAAEPAPEETPEATPEETPEATPEPTPEETPEATQEPVDEYQDYYDEMGARFGKYIVTTAEAAKIDTYSNMLRDALTQKDAAMCRTVKKNLDKLEKQLIKSSKKKLSALKKTIQSWEKKSASKTVKKSAVYKKLKQSAGKLEQTGDYAAAKSKYSECLKRLKSAKEKKSSKNDNRSTDYYKPLRKDDETHRMLMMNYLTREDVAKLNSEEVRYYVNTIFAILDYRFTNPDIRKFFEYQSWYQGGSTGNQEEIIERLRSADYYGTPLSENFNLLRNAR